MSRRRAAAVALLLAASFVAIACSSDSGSTNVPTTATTAQAPTTAPVTSTTLIVVTSPTWFSTPSGNISCVVRPDYARCDITKHTWEPPAKPSTCMLDWGPTLLADVAQPGRFGCVSDSVYRPEFVMPHGRSVHNGAMSCDVVVEGVTCRSESDHGFFVAAESYRLF